MRRKRKNNLNQAEQFVVDSIVQVYNSNGLVAEFTVTGKRQSGMFAFAARQKHDATATKLLFLMRVVVSMLEMRVKQDLEHGAFYVAPGRPVDEGQLSLPSMDANSGVGVVEDDTPDAEGT